VHRPADYFTVATGEAVKDTAVMTPEEREQNTSSSCLYLHRHGDKCTWDECACDCHKSEHDRGQDR
jgi:hypothetical protein